MPTTKEKNLPAKQETGGLPTYLQDYKGGNGLEGLSAEDFIIPRVKLLQDVSEEPKTYEAAKAGDFWINVIDLPIGGSFDFIPILNRKRYMLMPPIGDTRGVFARADDGVHWRPPSGEWEVKLKGVRNPVKWIINAPTVRESGLAEFGTSNPEDPDSNPAATLFYDFLVLIQGHNDLTTPVLLSLARSAAKKGRDLNGKVAFGNAPMQARSFRAAILQDKSTEGAFYNWIFTANGYVAEDEFKRAKAYADDFSKINFRGAEDEDTGEAPRGAAESKEF